MPLQTSCPHCRTRQTVDDALGGEIAQAIDAAFARPATGVLFAVLFGLAATWGGILMAYDSYYWTPGHSWPVSFCVVLLIWLIYLASTLRRPAKAAQAAARS